MPIKVSGLVFILETEIPTCILRGGAGVLPIHIKLRAAPLPKGCRGLPAGVWGVPKYPFSSFTPPKAVRGKSNVQRTPLATSLNLMHMGHDGVNPSPDRGQPYPPL